MTQKMKRKITKKELFNDYRRRRAVFLIGLTFASTVAVFYGVPALADRYDEQIKALREHNKSLEAKAAELRIYAATLAEELASLEVERQVILGQISETDGKIAVLTEKIKQTEREILDNQDALGLVLKEMYFADQISPIERLASSKTISDYINEETSRDSMRRSLINKVDEIEVQKKKLEEQKKQTEVLLASQKAQRDDVLAKETAKNKILSQTRGEESNYRALAEANNKKVKDLEAAQAEEMRRLAAQAGWNVPTGTIGGGGYPGKWAYAPLNAYTDSWGLYSRQCVSYAAWKVWSTGRFVPHFAGMGNANQWPSTTAKHGIPHGTTPKEGSVAVWYVGEYGHVMYVEKLNGDGTMWVSDYNWNWDGAYHYYKRSTAGLTYIYF